MTDLEKQQHQKMWDEITKFDTILLYIYCFVGVTSVVVLLSLPFVLGW